MTVFNAENFNIFSLGGQAVSYGLKDIHTIALEVTPELIGALSVEFEADLRYTVNPDRAPYFYAKVQRHDEEKEFSITICVNVGDWIVVLWDELHLFREKEMKHTFSFDLSTPAHELLETPGGFGIRSGDVDPEQTRIALPPASYGPIRNPSPTPRSVFGDDAIERSKQYEGNGPGVHETD